MRIAIIGSGALGSVFGGNLSADGHDVVLYDVWDEHIRTINESGLSMTRPDGTDVILDLPATTDPADLGSVDVAFVFVKAIHTDDAMQDVTPHLVKDTEVVTLQNGLSNVDIIRRHVRDDHVYGGYAPVGATLNGPGDVTHTSTMDSGGKLGGPDDNVAELLAATLTQASVPMTAVADPTPHIWSKQLYSVAFKPMAALTGLCIGPLGECEPTMAAMEALVREAVAVADAEGIDIPVENPITELHGRVETIADAKSSMLQDVENERPTEIDHINGVIVSMGDEHGVVTPYNRFAMALVKGRERSYLESS